MAQRPLPLRLMATSTGRGDIRQTTSCRRDLRLNVSVVAMTPLSALEKIVSSGDPGNPLAARQSTSAINTASGHLADVERHPAWMERAGSTSAGPYTSHKANDRPVGFQLIDIALKGGGVASQNRSPCTSLGRANHAESGIPVRIKN